jgi:hypothetical protein
MAGEAGSTSPCAYVSLNEVQRTQVWDLQHPDPWDLIPVVTFGHQRPRSEQSSLYMQREKLIADSQLEAPVAGGMFAAKNSRILSVLSLN